MGEDTRRQLDELSRHRRNSVSLQRGASSEEKQQIGYWMERQEEEEAAFLDSLDPRVPEVHHKLAERYADAI